MKTTLRVFVLLLCAVRVQAQPLVIHNHPQKATYADPSEWPTPWSSQGHWMNADGHMSHLHVDPLVPLYAEIDGTMTFSITVGLFDTAGSIVLERSEVLTGWHDGSIKGTLNLPPLQGVRGQFVTVTGTVTVKPPIPHGVFNLSVDITARTDDGVFQTVRARRPMYSTLDVSQPELTYNNWLSTECNFGSHVNGEDYGQQTVEFNYLASDPSQPFIPVPIAPMTNVWPMYMGTFGYLQSSFNGAPGAARFVLDPNYHAGDPGTTLESVTQFPDSQGNTDISHVPMIFNQKGTHKYGVIRDLPTPNVGEHVMCLLVGTITGTSRPFRSRSRSS
jgi:hypothetical protein